ncbi:histidine kinase [Ectothiorhodospira shaposhnikovii]|uniref:FIST signal transduction protein n=1 Tax=Ectothiorhodospira shaposhnikovii TaxID=1054 RepID=UPI001905B1F7|nr:FIST C-terminal domain-containing protein [Ectothiorhodospira shaposhnikovii]MBK1673005.1 histidine kinase [Ectothiorhodospira shaposhnikovii]
MITSPIRLHMEPTGHLDALTPCLQRMAQESGVSSIMVLGCDQDNWPHDEATRLFRECPLPVFGGIFPQIIHERRPCFSGTLLVGLPVTAQLAVVRGLSDADADLDQSLAQTHATWPEVLENSTVIVFVDGLSSRISALIESLFLYFGLDVNFVGGGAGSLSFKKRPCIITPDGLCQDTAVLAHIPLVSRIGVTHGWKPISDTLKVTSSERNIIHTLDWQPAFQVYRRMIRDHGGQNITRENFFDIAKAYPFGISKLDSELVVRDPLMVVGDQSLICVGEVQEGCFVRLLNGTPDSLIQAATQARVIAESQGSCDTASPALFIDCISRVLFLGDRIHQELEGAGAGMPLFGAFTLGEIANTGNDYMDFLNKSSVLCLLDVGEGPSIETT